MTIVDMAILAGVVLLFVAILLRSKLARAIIVETFQHPLRKAVVHVEPTTGEVTVTEAGKTPDSVGRPAVV